MISKIDINKYLQFFYDYTNSLLPTLKFREDEHILKIKHTEEVLNLALYIIDQKKINDLNNNITEITEILSVSILLSSLFHDIGRFKQYYDFGTFKDTISINHGELSFKIINDAGILNDLFEKNAILNSIRYHNSKNIPEILKHDDLTYNTIKILRDLDKLDIFRVVIEQLSFDKDKQTVMLHLVEKNEITYEVYNKIMKNITVSYNELITQDDFKALQLGWIFELNFKEVLNLLKENNYHERIFETMHKNERSENIFNKVNDYLNNMII